MPEAGPGIVLVGMPGSGKSTVGRLVAERLGRPFIDTDERFAEHHGTPVPAYLAEHGEPAFRAAEAAVVADAVRTGGAVIAAGGGAALDPLNRWALWHHGVVAWLDVPAGEPRRPPRGRSTPPPHVPAVRPGRAWRPSPRSEPPSTGPRTSASMGRGRPSASWRS